jgi:8-oxo-dGTP pyrophosphatase MutT (NUDIX family)
MKQIDAAIAVITRGGRILVCQRHETDTFGGLWEFPGGKRESGETLEQCLARELIEELAVRAKPVAQLTLYARNADQPSLCWARFANKSLRNGVARPEPNAARAAT